MGNINLEVSEKIFEKVYKGQQVMAKNSHDPLDQAS
jgi:hypothetical protein